MKRLEQEFGGNNGDDLCDELLARNVSLEQIERAAEITRERRGELANAFGFFRAQLRTGAGSTPSPQKPTTRRRFYIANEPHALEIICAFKHAEDSRQFWWGLRCLERFPELSRADRLAVARHIVALGDEYHGRSYGHVISDACEAVLRESTLAAVKEL